MPVVGIWSRARLSKKRAAGAIAGDAFSLVCERNEQPLGENHLPVDFPLLLFHCKQETCLLTPFGRAIAPPCPAGWTVNLLSAAHHLAWTQHPTIWLCEACAILWLVLRVIRSPWVRLGVLQMLCGLMLNALVTEANSGTMPVVGIPSTLHPASPVWQAATSNTRLPFLADQAGLGLFSIGDLVLISGGILILAICLQQNLKPKSSLNSCRLGWALRDTNGSPTEA